MEKRYQVFVSSTFTDLKEERQAALRAILELSHMPAGMELFPAADDSAWQLIKDVIDASDYYVVIVGGRYGSVDPDGIGYTEREYRYAVQARKPITALLHEHPEGLPRERTETESHAWKQLAAFRSALEGAHTCVYWKTAEDLRSKIVLSLTSAMKRRPGVGWVRADVVPTGATLADVFRLQHRVAELEAEANAARFRPPAGTEDFRQGEDVLVLETTFNAYPYGDILHTQHYEGKIHLTWNQLFAAVAPSLITEGSLREVRAALKRVVTQRGREVFGREKNLRDHELESFTVQEHDLETVIIQFRALGLIRESARQRSVKDKETYFTLTPYGDTVMTQLRAIRRVPLESHALPGEEAQEGGEGTMEAPDA